MGLLQARHSAAPVLLECRGIARIIDTGLARALRLAFADAGLRLLEQVTPRARSCGA